MDTDTHLAMFRESGCVGHFAKLLQEVFPPEVPEARFIAESREKAGWGVLQLLRLFLVRGENSTPRTKPPSSELVQRKLYLI